MKVCKFGGSSVADANRIRAIAHIIANDRDRRFIVVSAPGKRHKDDKKITDLLYLCHELAGQGLDIDDPFTVIEERFLQITTELGISLDTAGQLSQIRRAIQDNASLDFAVSRGEYLCGIIFASFIGARFIDAADYVKIRENGSLDDLTFSDAFTSLDSNETYVMPGFYGSDSSGKIRVFSRGGSDISGAIAARGMNADVYENWTDVSGFLMADPNIVESPKPIRELTYREVRELAYMGAKVFHEEAIFPVYPVGIPINIRNTNDPDDPGTLITQSRDSGRGIVAGIAGRTGFTLIVIEKMLMNKEIGFGRRLFEILESHDVSFEHAPSGIDTMSVIVGDSELEGKDESILDEIHRVLEPDQVEIQNGLSLISVVGEGMSHKIGIAARLFQALSRADVNVRIIDQGSSEINITVGVSEDDFSEAIKAINDEFHE